MPFTILPIEAPDGAMRRAASLADRNRSTAAVTIGNSIGLYKNSFHRRDGLKLVARDHVLSQDSHLDRGWSVPSGCVLHDNRSDETGS